MEKTYSICRLSTVNYGLLFTLVITCLLSGVEVSGVQAQRPPTQPLDLPLVSDLERSLQAFYEDERDAHLIAFDSGTKNNWADLIPSVGVTYTLSNDPRPTISWSPISILNRKDAKRKESLTREALLRSYEVIISDRLYKLRQLVHDYFIDLDELKIKEETLHLDERLYDIEEERYAQNLMKPSEHLREQKRIMLARSIVSSYKQELHKKRSEVIYTAKWVDKDPY